MLLSERHPPANMRDETRRDGVMKLPQIRLSNFQSFGPEATLFGMAVMTFLLGAVVADRKLSHF